MSTLILNQGIRTLSVSERSLLEQQEAIIEENISTIKTAFRKIGEALKPIYDQSLWREDYKSFDDYCRSRWDFGQGAGHRHMSASTIAQRLEAHGLPAPERQSHAYGLKGLDEEASVEVWRRLVNDEGKINTGSVELAVKEHELAVKEQRVLSSGFDEIARGMERGAVSVENAYHITATLSRAAPEVQELVRRYGVNGARAISPEAIAKLNNLPPDLLQEIKDTEGYIEVGGDQVHLSTVNERDIDDFAIGTRIRTRLQAVVTSNPDVLLTFEALGGGTTRLVAVIEGCSTTQLRLNDERIKKFFEELINECN